MIKEAHRNVKMMGTSIDLMVVHENPEFVLDEMVERLKMYEQRFSANDDASELARINQAAGKKSVQVHPELFELIEIGKKHSLASESFLNIAIGPLIQAWRIGFSDARVPEKQEIEELLKITNPKSICLERETFSVYLREKGMKIDLGALAKGYIADRLVDYLKEVKVNSALINLGGNIITYGPALKRADNLWRIGIQKPLSKRGEAQVILKVDNQSVVTSGIYERLFDVGNDTYHHIFDPKTGYPVETELASLTIVSDLSVDCEIWTTRLFGHSPRDIIEELNQMDAIDGLVITKQGEIFYSDGLRNKIV